ncbi:type II toxin-antitoxin system VapC family toxin [Sphingomonas sp. PAMC 26605]|uniref:type II toxin-antitoxin system VapC family toxin n=1 Tax=Sphingomonas sp. PAMC 26605 TaxID=1112214 RepID=UPI00026CD141|nr:type II toxin-antitoxin system VapC family toxin [Sphingomonas sp. PAMC 26605]
MKYLLDSNIIIALAMGNSDQLTNRAAQCDEDEIVTSAVALAEVVYGSARDKPPALDQLRAFIEEVPVLAFDYKAAVAYATLPFRRGGYDRLIAAHALSHDLTVVTDNQRHFADIPGLRVENWMA